MNAVIIYDKVAEKMTDPDHKDVLEQVRAVSEVLDAMGYTPLELGITMDLTDLEENLKRLCPAFVFNLVEVSGRVRPVDPSATRRPWSFLKSLIRAPPRMLCNQTSNKGRFKEAASGVGSPHPGSLFPGRRAAQFDSPEGRQLHHQISLGTCLHRDRG